MAETKNNKTGAIIGLGGLGCPALLSLIECWPIDLKLTLKLIDNDIVSSSNLNRQILFSSDTIGQRKIDAAQEGLKKYFGELPSFVSLDTYFEKISLDNIDSLLAECDFILDCTDDVEFKMLINHYALFNKKILIYAGVQGFNGIVLPIIPNGPCLNCVFGDFTKEEACELGGSCRAGGVIGSIAGLTALTQVNELMSCLNDKTKNTEINLHAINSSGVIRKISTKINPNCANGCTPNPVKTVDLRAFKCPDTFLYAKLALEKLRSELKNSLEVEFRFGSYQDLENVAQSLEQEGFKRNKKIICKELSEYKLLFVLLND